MYINTTIPCKCLSYKGLSLTLVLEAGLEPARLLRPKDFKSPPNPPFELPLYLFYLIVNLVFNPNNNSVLEL